MDEGVDCVEQYIGEYWWSWVGRAGQQLGLIYGRADPLIDWYMANIWIPYHAADTRGRPARPDKGPVCRPYHAIPEYADQTLFTLAHFSYDQLSTPFPISSQPSSEYSLLKCQWKPYFIIEASVRCQKQSTHRSEKYSILINAFLFPLKHITCQIFQPTTQALSTRIQGCQWKL